MQETVLMYLRKWCFYNNASLLLFMQLLASEPVSRLVSWSVYTQYYELTDSLVYRLTEKEE